MLKVHSIWESWSMRMGFEKEAYRLEGARKTAAGVVEGFEMVYGNGKKTRAVCKTQSGLRREQQVPSQGPRGC